MLLHLVVKFSIAGYGFLQKYAPSNRLLRILRQRTDPYWALRISLYALPYFFGACLVRLSIEAGGPGWLHIFFWILMWNTLKFLPYWPVFTVKSLIARLRQAREQRLQPQR